MKRCLLGFILLLLPFLLGCESKAEEKASFFPLSPGITILEEEAVKTDASLPEEQLSANEFFSRVAELFSV